MKIKERRLKIWVRIAKGGQKLMTFRWKGERNKILLMRSIAKGGRKLMIKILSQTTLFISTAKGGRT